ncbi:hypothetical protein ACNF49_12340 [Actinomadura sp. ATCC 39365]
MDEFRMREGGLARFVAPFAGPLVLFFAVCLLLGAILTGSSALGVVIGALATAALTGVLVVKHRRLVAGTVVRFSPEGVELADARGFRVRLRWPDITGIGVVDTRPADPRLLGRPGGVRVRVQALRSARSTRCGNGGRWATGSAATGPISCADKRVGCGLRGAVELPASPGRPGTPACGQGPVV